MTYTIKHIDTKRPFVPSTIEVGRNKIKFRFSQTRKLRIQFPGKLKVVAEASYFRTVKHPDGGFEKEEFPVPCKVEITRPDGTLFIDAQKQTGKLFINTDITLDDLKQFRDLRGTVQEEEWEDWNFTIHGESKIIDVLPPSVTAEASGNFHITYEETITSKSAPPLIDDMLKGKSGRYKFDLFRVGTFNATAKGSFAIGNVTMQLFDPDGMVVAQSGNGRLIHPVTLRTLNKSRDANGNPRLWSLQVFSTSVDPFGGIKVFASVIEKARIDTSALLARIDHLFGVGLNKLSIFSELTDSHLLARLRIHDIVTAETIGIHDLLESVIESVAQDPGVDKNHITTDDTYTLYRKSRGLGHDMKISECTINVKAINIRIGPSEVLQPTIPTLKLEVIFEESSAKVDFHGFDLASAKVRDNHIGLEIGLRLNPNGSFSPEMWIEKDRLDADVAWDAGLAALGIDVFLTAGLLTLGAKGTAEIVEEYVTEFIETKLRNWLFSKMERATEILAMVIGDDLTYRSLGFEGNDIVFEYIAPLEPDPKPSEEYQYVGVIGRSFAANGAVFPSFGDTWSVPNLVKNIDHIVVVMMENRSFDHVLGYRAQLKGVQGSDGLSERLINLLQAMKRPEGQEIKFRKLKKSEYITPTKLPNGEEKKTAFPRSVPHDFAAMTQQLAEKTKIPFPGQDPSKPRQFRTINSPVSFVTSYMERKGIEWDEALDVLGYYGADDLPFFAFLAENYAYSEQFYCSHPGPTLPNRMYLLTGDVQYDRTDRTILDNNHSDNFALSRAMSIFDLLERKGVKWRVYESFPSVTMLRMFARYATDNTNIVPISRLQEDISKEKENFPAVTFIEPAMHHFPQNDDHAPDGDMWRGQCFLQDVYDALRSEEKLWQKTMLIITYDEHGGFYDHVDPPIADMLIRPGEGQIDPNLESHFTASPVIIKYGARVPTFVVSPWSSAGEGPNLTLDFCSILKTIAARFCGEDKPFLSARVNASLSLDAYVSEAQSRMNVQDIAKLPRLPEVNENPQIITSPISRKQLQNGNVDYHDLTGMLARQLGR